jgi:hypothetical protein
MEIFIPLTLWEIFSERAIDDRIDVCGFILNFFSTKVKSKGYLTKTAAFSLNHQSRFSKSSEYRFQYLHASFRPF